MSTDHNLWRERRAEADSNRGPSAYQPNALPLGQTGSRLQSFGTFSFIGVSVNHASQSLDNPATPARTCGDELFVNGCPWTEEVTGGGGGGWAGGVGGQGVRRGSGGAGRGKEGAVGRKGRGSAPSVAKQVRPPPTGPAHKLFNNKHAGLNCTGTCSLLFLYFIFTSVHTLC